MDNPEKIAGFITDRYIEVVTQAGLKYKGVCLSVNRAFLELEDNDPEEGSIRSLVFQANIDAIIIKEKDIDEEEI